MLKYLNLPIYILFLALICTLYARYGAADHLPAYYNESNRQLRKNHTLLRPMYARLNKELQKSRLQMPFELDNLDLILSFASLNAKFSNGVLPTEVHQLLNAVLRIVPQQVTALNLLAIDAYKKENYQLAVDYWDKILVLATNSEHANESVEILRKKVAETRTKIAKT